jgi:hypothetical protein
MMAPQQQGDPNMLMARAFAEALGPAPALPQSLQVIARRAELVDAIDGSLVATVTDLVDVTRQIAQQIRRVEEGTRKFMPDVPDAMVKINIGLRLWSGCLSAAKTIAHETRSGPNSSALRAQLMPEIDRIAATDAIFAAGVEAAPAFKRLRGQTYSMDGVPAESLVLRDA